MPFEIRAIKAGDKLTGLSFGGEQFAPLKTYVQKHAVIYEAKHLARTYGCFFTSAGAKPQTKLVGYISLVCGEVVVDGDDDNLVAEEGVHFPYKHYPAVKIARLAVDQRFRIDAIGNKLRLGSKLYELALGIVQTDICPNVGCRFLMVDAKSDSVGFYEKIGFTTLDTTENRERADRVMFIDMAKL